MSAHLSRRRILAILVTILLGNTASHVFADQVLIADRLSNRILRYSASGSYLGVVSDDTNYLSEPNGMALTGSMLYVANRQSSTVVGFNFNGYTAGDPPIVTNEGLSVPSSILIDENAEVAKMYVSNLGAAFDGSTVLQLKLDGSPAGDPLTGGLPVGRSGLAFAPDGSLLVSSFQDGEVLKYNTESSSFETFIGNSGVFFGAGNLLVDDNALYVAYGFSGAIMKYDATTGQPDPGFTPISGLEFPASLSLSPDGNGILVGILGFANGTGRIDQYAADGTLVGTWANNSANDPSLGFVEPTGLLVVPDPAGVVGDTNGDGEINLDDLNNVRNNFGATGAADGTLAGDAFPFNGVVDLDDLNGVRNSFGGPIDPEIGSPSSVPEPNAFAIAALAIGLGSIWLHKMQ